MLKLLFSIVYLAHICGCIWHLMAIIEHNYGFNNTWLHLNDLFEKSNETKYVNALYYSVITMITVGHFQIESTTEKAISIVVVLALSGTFAYSLNRIGIITEYMFKNEEELRLII